MKITVLTHNFSSNAVMRAHRLALACRQFADVTLFGPVKSRGLWAPLPLESWIKPIPSRRLPKVFRGTLDPLLDLDTDLLIAVKPYLMSYGLGLVAAECRRIPLILDIDDLDTALAPEMKTGLEEVRADLRDATSTVYLRILSRCTAAASAITVSSTRLQGRFGGTLVPHGCPVERMDPAAVDRDAARKRYGFEGPVILFPGTGRLHKGLKPLAKAVSRVAGARLAVLCRPEDFPAAEWSQYPLLRLPVVPYAELSALLAAADVIALPQLQTEAASYQMPMKLYDAMAMAKPIVTTTVSDLPLALGDCGLLVPPGDVPSLAQAIQHLLDNPEQAQALGQRARERCLGHFTMGHVAEALRLVIQQTSAAGGKGRMGI